MKNIKYAILLICAVAFASCDKYLVQFPTDQYTDAQVWQDTYLIEANLAELYASCCVMMNDSPCSFGTSPVNMEFSQGWNWNGNLGLGAEGEGPVHAITMGDECKYSERGAQTNYHSYKMNGVQRNSSLFRWWNNAYYLNRQLNHFIENIDDSPVTDAVSLKSEARFIRAYNYFALVKRYGGVPLILKETALDAPEEELYPYRASAEEVYDFIFKELEEIADLLPAAPLAGRAGKGAALALLSRAALYAGSIAKYDSPQYQLVDPVTNKLLCGLPAEKANDYFQKAYDACGRIMTECNYSLYKGNADKVQNLRDIFLVKNNCEAIMVRRFDGTKESNYLWSWDIALSPKPNAWSVGQYALAYYNFIEQFEFKDGTSGAIDRTELVSHPWDMKEFFADRDPRLIAWHWTNGSEWPGAIGGEPKAGDPENKVVFGKDTISMYDGIKHADGFIYDNVSVTADPELGIMSYGDQQKEMANAGLLRWRHTGFGIRKRLDPMADNNTWFCCSTSDFQIFRYAEILLNYAEAALELGKTGEALDAVNQIRSRAGVAELGSIDMDSYRHERQIELCYENHRYWDLIRWRIAKEKIDGVDHEGIRWILDAESFKAGHSKFWIEINPHVDSDATSPKFPDSNYYLPIGDGTIALNDHLVENPGYGY
ncbi:MAG: RagB/SusD family nutrient uptake outer membrane protein [Bacteroidales bacterium]|nr:RagB/SusD family nutrient uptake outer membrane protein [Bacteroidales bacterium]